MDLDEEYLQKLMRTVSHDMGGTLRLAIGFSKLLLENYDDKLDEKALNWLSLIKQDSEKTQEKLVALSRYARLYGIRDGQVCCDLEHLCRKAISISNFDEIYPDFPVTIEHLPMVMGFERLWIDYFAEVLTNSARHSGGAASIRCRVYCEILEDSVQIVVADTGIGMTAKEIEMAQQPFRTIDSGSTAGVGMGLSIVKRIAELQGGHLSLKSGATDSPGLQVIVTLPTSVVVNLDE